MTFDPNNYNNDGYDFSSWELNDDEEKEFFIEDNPGDSGISISGN